jgi:Fe-S-cluster containining protein
MSNNKSPYIRPEVDCKGCGKCCEIFEISFPLEPGNQGEWIFRSEIERIRMLEGMEEKTELREEPETGTLWLIFKIPCQHLQADKSCAIYHDPKRPLLCRCFPYRNSTKASCPKVRN